MSEQRTVTAAAMLSGSLAPLNSTMIVVALPSILADLGAPLTWGSWIIVSYLVTMAAVQPLGGRLGDRFGDRRLLMVGLTCFLAASCLAALAPNVIVLIVARTAQALSGAIALPNGSALIRRLVPFTSQGRAFGIIGAGIGVAAALGPPLGGIVTDALGWRMTFVANLAVIVPALLLAYRLPRRHGEGESAAGVAGTGVAGASVAGASVVGAGVASAGIARAGEASAAAGRGAAGATTAPERRRPFDVAGAATLVVALVSLALSLTIWRVPEVPGWATPALVALAIGAGVWLLRHLRRVAEPVL
ncbi:MAG TPA: MFS transporter, partial [Trueperaceae bacterium]|nr:MFS transporter [Trueperaceae bacterium]